MLFRSGGARGLAHIVVLETLDELGVRPVAISGSSMGAIIGAAYAAGCSGKELRAHAHSIFRDKPTVIARLMRARVGRLSDFLVTLDSNPALVDAEILLDHFWPRPVPDRFEQLKLPFACIATDYHGRRAAIFETGPLAPAVAGSMAIPGLVKPVELDGLALIDGGMVDPLPYRTLMDRADAVIACDVTGGAPSRRRTAPRPTQAILGAAQIVQQRILEEMLQRDRPHLLLRPNVAQFGALDFFRTAEILDAAHNVQAPLRRFLEKYLQRA